jgi:hypothetical protein
LKKKEIVMNVPWPQPKSPALLAPVLAALLLFPGVPTAARGAEVDCLDTYVTCVEKASNLDGVPRRSWAGLRCAYDLLSCLQRRLA